MIKIIKSAMLILCIAITCKVSAQNQAGIVSYKGMINKTYVDSFLTDLKQKDVPMNIKQGVVEMYTNATPDKYFLNIKNEESYYYHNPSLDEEGGYNIGSKAGRNSFYTSNSSDSIIEISPYLGNIAHNSLDWKVTHKTKTIGGFKCFQAVATEKLYSRRGHYYNRKVTAWFAPKIPLNFGPKYYKGLPGLILEIERDEFTLTATKINLNPSEDVKIKRIEKNDNVISQKESFKRIKEMEGDRKKSMSSNR